MSSSKALKAIYAGNRLLQEGSSRAIAETKKALPIQSKAFGAAQAAANLEAGYGTRMATERGQQMQGRATAGLARRGLGNSTLSNVYRSGIIGDVEGHKAQIQARLGAQLGQIGNQRAGMLGTTMGGLAGMLQGQAGQQADFASRFAQFQFAPKAGLFDVLGAAAPYAALAFGGGGRTPGSEAAVPGSTGYARNIFGTP